MRQFGRRAEARDTPEQREARRERKRVYAARRYHEVIKKDPIRYERALEGGRKRAEEARRNRPELQAEEAVSTRRRRRRRFVKAGVKARQMALKQYPCMDCKRRFPVCCMDFDHREPGQKSPQLKYGTARVVSMPKALRDAEIAKCDLVCSCCHRIRTAKRLGSPTAEPWWDEHEEGPSR